MDNNGFPSPLTIEEEQYYLSLNATGSSEARKKLIEHNLRFVVHIAKKFKNNNIYFEDLISIGTIGLIKAINNYKIEKNVKLATFAAVCIENQILMYLRKNKKHNQTMSLEEPICINNDGDELSLMDMLVSSDDIIEEEVIKKESIHEVINALSLLDDKQKKVIVLRYLEYMTQKEIGNILGISQSLVSRIEKEALKKIKFLITYKNVSNMHTVKSKEYCK
ncbi:MAG: sigma-70 family RNA polymerase sigma factor [Bacilli bacterium]|nr:sigma-70 family RNA polymerase sigma factor [Bacilli bacterium]